MVAYLMKNQDIDFPLFLPFPSLKSDCIKMIKLVGTEDGRF